MYWMIRAKRGEIDNKIDEFFKNNIWQIEYNEKYQDIVKKIQIGNILCLYKGSYIKTISLPISDLKEII